MGEMQENFQQKLRSMWNLCCVVCSEPWYTDRECSDSALRVSFAMHAVRTSKCKFFLLLCKQTLEPYPKTTCTGATANVQQFL